MQQRTTPYLAPTVTIPKTAQGSFIFPRGPEWFSYPYAGRPYVGMRPPKPLFSTSATTGKSAESHFKSLYDGLDRSKTWTIFSSVLLVTVIILLNT